jgi:sigma-B regulation protein RsbU (phosphoserine phosphatase)
MASSIQQFSSFLRDLQQLEKAPARSESAAASGALILDAFLRHTDSSAGVVYFRAGDAAFRLAARTACEAPDLLDADGLGSLLQVSSLAEMEELSFVALIHPPPSILVPLRNTREHLGFVALTDSDRNGRRDEAELELIRLGAAFASTVLTNHRLTHEMREGDFQLKYRLWELESLYDIGLSIASTLNMDELAEEILVRTVSLINARRAALYLREGSRFILYRSFGETRPEFLDRELDADLSDRLLNDTSPVTFDSQTDCIFPGCGSLIALPIRGNNDVIGVIAAADRETREGGLGAFEANDLRLLSLFGSQVAIALENARLHRQALEKQAMERDLELAATIQRDILPKKVPTVAGFDLAAVARPARQVGGDYHGFVERDGSLIVCVADVAGKSMPAALLVSALHAALQLLFAEGRELAEIATELNRHIHRWSAENKFITMVLASLDPEDDTIRYVNAGHNPAYILIGDRLELVKSHGLPIGIMPNSRYSTQTRPFPKGSTFVVYSDGITEAENLAGEEFENPRLEAILMANLSATARQLAEAITRDVDAFVGEAPQKDDQTLLIVKSVQV